MAREITYRVKTFRGAGLSAHWKKTVEGKPYIVVRKPGESNWWVCDAQMFKTMQREGVKAGYESHTVLGDIFSISAR